MYLMIHYILISSYTLSLGTTQPVMYGVIRLVRTPYFFYLIKVWLLLKPYKYWNGFGKPSGTFCSNLRVRIPTQKNCKRAHIMSHNPLATTRMILLLSIHKDSN